MAQLSRRQQGQGLALLGHWATLGPVKAALRQPKQDISGQLEVTVTDCSASVARPESQSLRGSYGVAGPRQATGPAAAGAKA